MGINIGIYTLLSVKPFTLQEANGKTKSDII